MRRHDALALSNFETFLVKVSGEIRKAKNDTLQLESALKR